MTLKYTLTPLEVLRQQRRVIVERITRSGSTDCERKLLRDILDEINYKIMEVKDEN